MLDVFFDNVLLMKNSGVSFMVELTPGDSYIPYIDEMVELCETKIGAKPQITVCRYEKR